MRQDKLVELLQAQLGWNALPALSITHNFATQEEAELDIDKSRQSTPHDRVPRRSILLAGEIAAQSGKFDEVRRKSRFGARLDCIVFDE